MPNFIWAFSNGSIFDEIKDNNILGEFAWNCKKSCNFAAYGKTFIRGMYAEV